MKQHIAIGGAVLIALVFIAGVYIGKSARGETPQPTSADVSAADSATVPAELDDETGSLEQDIPEVYEVTGEYSYSDMSGFERFATTKGPFGTPAVIVERDSAPEYAVPDGTMGNFSLHADTVGTLSPFGDSCTLIVEVTYEISAPERMDKKNTAGSDIISAHFERVVKKGNVYDSCWSESGKPTRTLRTQPTGPQHQSPQTIQSVSLAADKQSVQVKMLNAKNYTIRVSDIPPHSMGMMPTGPNGESVPTTCAPQGIYDANISAHLPGKVIMNVTSGLCPFHSDFSDTVVIDPITKKQYVFAGKSVAFSDDGTCSLQEIGDGDRGGTPSYTIVNPHSGVIAGKFSTFQKESVLQKSFTALTGQTIAEDDYYWFDMNGFEKGSCRVMFSTRNPQLYGGIWVFSVNVWGNNPKLVAKP